MYMQTIDVSPSQLRAARALVGVSRDKFAEKAGVSLSTLVRIENGGWATKKRGGRVIHAFTSTISKIIAAHEREGVRFSRDGLELQRAKGEEQVVAA
jgi:DNA-binding XRE family transcriptional regulator